MPRRLALLVILAVVLLPLASGCGPSRPAVVEAHGVVLLDNQPLPNAVIEFYPMVEGFDSQMKSTGITDDQGKFTLKCAYQDQNGAAVAKHKVVVYENPPPGAQEERERGSRDRSSTPPINLPNRPIPPKYGTVGATPLEIEVVAGQSEYKVELKR